MYAKDSEITLLLSQIYQLNQHVTHIAVSTYTHAPKQYNHMSLHKILQPNNQTIHQDPHP